MLLWFMSENVLPVFSSHFVQLSQLHCWRGCLFSFKYSCLLCHSSIDCRCVGLFLSSLFWFIGLYVWFCANTTLFWLLELCSIIWSQEELSLQLVYSFFSRLICSSSVKKCHGYFGRDHIKSVDCFGSVQFSSVTQLCPTHCDPMNRSTPGLPVHHKLLEFTQTHAHWVSDAIQPSHPLSSPSPAPNPSQHQGLFQWVNSSHELANYWSFSFSISPSNKHPGLISFRLDWLDLLAVQRILKSLFKHHSSKASIFWCSAFFTVQLSHPYMITGKTIALTRWTFVGRVMSLLFNMLSRLVITFLTRSKCLLISWLQSPSAVIFRAPKNKVWI